MTTSLNQPSIFTRLFIFSFVLAAISARAQIVTIPLETSNNALVLQADEKKNTLVKDF
jgi:hypothetical protein